MPQALRKSAAAVDAGRFVEIPEGGPTVGALVYFPSQARHVN
jgi:hypothetical protein